MVRKYKLVYKEDGFTLLASIGKGCLVVLGGAADAPCLEVSFLDMVCILVSCSLLTSFKRMHPAQTQPQARTKQQNAP